MRKTSITLLWILNLFDAIMTWFAVDVAQYAHEANPSMAWAIRKGWLVFFAIKLGIMAIITVTLQYVSKGADRQFVKVIIWCMVGFYGLVAAWHVYGLFLWHVLN